MEARGKIQQDAKKGKMSEQSKAVLREDSHLADRARVMTTKGHTLLERGCN